MTSMITLVLDLLDTGAKFLLLEKQREIQDQVVKLRSDYAIEINKPDGQIDDARLYSIQSELRILVSVYSAAVQAQGVPPSAGTTS